MFRGRGVLCEDAVACGRLSHDELSSLGGGVAGVGGREWEGAVPATIAVFSVASVFVVECKRDAPKKDKGES